MIESYYWKKDLLEHANKLKPVKKPKRWTEKAHVNFEKDIIISFFKIRKLIEEDKLSNKSKNARFHIEFYKRKNLFVKPGFLEMYDPFDLNHNSVTKSIFFICNLFIHSNFLMAERDETRNWHGIYLSSDKETVKGAYFITTCIISEIFGLVGSDYPSRISIERNKDNIWEIETD